MGLSSKMVNVLRSIYSATKSTVWDGYTLSNQFETVMGLRQGCLLSPLLFSLFVNDLHDSIPGGINVGDSLLRILLYADDLTLLADDPETLQTMINSLAEYCDRWNLQVNLDKSKIVIFRKGGKRASSEKWVYKDSEIEVVNSYKYLGVKLTYNMSLKPHLEEKLNLSKSCINATWSSLLNDKEIKPSSKFKIFEATARSIMFYAAQVWGFQKYEETEKLLRFFIKRIFRLPYNTPNYMIHIETGLPALFLQTLSLHFDYIRKIMSYSDERLPKILAKQIISHKIYWAEEWQSIFESVGMEINLENSQTWQASHRDALLSLKYKEWNEHVGSARGGQFHDEYHNLEYVEVPNYFSDRYSSIIKMIFMTRGGLLDLNARAFKYHTDGICTICNLDASENTFHFIAVCPVFSNYRRRFLGGSTLQREQFLNLLNGQNYESLHKYLVNAYRYRKLIITGF